MSQAYVFHRSRWPFFLSRSGACCRDGTFAALCARRDLQALREAQEEMTVRDIAAATGIKDSALRQLLKGVAKEGEIRWR